MLDVILRGGRVLDGAGNVDVPADVAIDNGRIAAVGWLRTAEARENVDVTGLTICPGFVDVHCHSDALPFAAEPLPAKILQGVTTEINGNCGSTAFPLLPETADLLKEHQAGLFADTPWDWTTAAEFFASLERAGPISNIAQLVGHNALRVAAFGFQNRAPTDDELKTMRRLLEESLADGAVGFSSGLIYAPGFYSQTPELVALAEVMRSSGRPYCSHVRGETVTLFQAHAEAIQIGEWAGVPVQHSHLKAAGRANHGRAGELLRLLEAARERGVEVTGDAYPYDAGSTRMAALLPPWSQEGGRDLMLERLTVPAERDRIKRDFRDGIPGWENLAGAGGWDKVRVSSVETNQSYLGKSIQLIAEERGSDPADALCDVLVEERGRPTIVVTMMDEPDVRQILEHRLVMIGSDAIITRGKPHPRTWGTYPRVLGHYAREVGLFSQAEAVRKMTSLPSQKFGLWDRGLVRPGLAADLVIFDPKTILDRATYEDPEQAPAGLPHVIVNGVFAVRDGRYTGARAGKVLRA
ncbi:MAG: D-aminoacylase [Chloroflexota bacterium]|nr:D-aminoacylase [Chloroflexota bacterium]